MKDQDVNPLQEALQKNLVTPMRVRFRRIEKMLFGLLALVLLNLALLIYFILRH